MPNEQLAVEKRKTYETVEALRRRFGRLAGLGFLSPDEFAALSDLLDQIARIVNDADNEAG